MSDLPPGFVVERPNTGPSSLPDGFIMQGQPQAGQPVASQEKSYFGMIPLVKGIVKSAISGATLPGDVYAGRAQIPSSGAVPGSVPFGDVNSSGERVADLAGLITPINPAARAGDKLIPGIARAAVTEAPAIPTTEAIKSAAKEGFETAKGMGVDFAPSAVRDVAAAIEKKLQSKGILEEHAPSTYKTLERLKEPPPDAVAVTVSDLHNLRQAFGNSAGSLSHPKDALAGSIGKDAVDALLTSPPEAAVLAGDAAAAGKILKDAIGNSAAVSRVEDVGARLTRADRQAAKSGSGSNIDNAIRQKISAILDSKHGTRGFTPEEVAQMEQVVRGTATANFARKLGKFGFGDGLSLLLHGGAALSTGGMTLPIGVAGTGARKIAEMITQRGANRIDEMIRTRSPLAQATPMVTRGLTESEQAARAAVVRALLAAQSRSP